VHNKIYLALERYVLNEWLYQGQEKQYSARKATYNNKKTFQCSYAQEIVNREETTEAKKKKNGIDKGFVEKG
jgi:hypothetical protein